MDAASAFGSGSNGQARWSLHVLGGFELSALPGAEKPALGKRERVLRAQIQPRGVLARPRLAGFVPAHNRRRFRLRLKSSNRIVAYIAYWRDPDSNVDQDVCLIPARIRTFRSTNNRVRVCRVGPRNFT